jgi:hypothetical protein
VQLLCCRPTLDEVVIPFPLIAAAIREALQAPAPAMVHSKVAFVNGAIFVGSLASPAGSKTVEQRLLALPADRQLWTVSIGGHVVAKTVHFSSKGGNEVVQSNTLQVVQAHQISGNAPMGHVFLPVATVAEAAGKLGCASSMTLVILPGTIIGVTVRAGMLAAAVSQGVQDLTLHMQPCHAV